MKSPFDYSAAERRDVYRDTYQRLQSDATFNSIVERLAVFAQTYGYTPGELRQVAFAAALLVEMRSVRPVYIEREP